MTNEEKIARVNQLITDSITATRAAIVVAAVIYASFTGKRPFNFQKKFCSSNLESNHFSAQPLLLDCGLQLLPRAEGRIGDWKRPGHGNGCKSVDLQNLHLSSLSSICTQLRRKCQVDYKIMQLLCMTMCTSTFLPSLMNVENIQLISLTFYVIL